MRNTNSNRERIGLEFSYTKNECNELNKIRKITNING